MQSDNAAAAVEPVGVRVTLDITVDPRKWLAVTTAAPPTPPPGSPDFLPWSPFTTREWSDDLVGELRQDLAKFAAVQLSCDELLHESDGTVRLVKVEPIPHDEQHDPQRPQPR